MSRCAVTESLDSHLDYQDRLDAEYEAESPPQARCPHCARFLAKFSTPAPCVACIKAQTDRINRDAAIRILSQDIDKGIQGLRDLLTDTRALSAELKARRAA